MKAILVNAEERTVTLVDIDGSLESINNAIGSRCFTVAAYYDNNDAVFADDEGLLGNPQDFVEVGCYPEPIAGNLLIIGTTDDGDSTDVVSTVEDIEKDAIFYDLATVLNRR